MTRKLITPRAAMILFIVVVAVSFTQAVWWVVFMAQLTAEKVDIAADLGGSAEYVERIHQEEVKRQIMIGTEGLFFLTLTLVGAGLIYRALRHQETLKRQQENFLMAVTHELKTPLASMEIYLDTLESPKIPVEKKAAILPRIRADIGRLERLIQNILEASRFEERSYRPDDLKVDLTELVRASVDRVSGHAWEAPVEIKTRFTPGVVVTGDEAALKRAVIAVLENGVKYSEGSPIQLTVSLEIDARWAVISVADRGVGLDSHDREAIFERFYRVGSELTRSRAGTGLGLYLCREIVRAHGGDVTAHSAGLGKGTTVTMKLPLSESYEDDIAG